MHTSDVSADISEPRAEVADRADLPRSFLNTAWPLAAAALILLMLVHACVLVAPSTKSPAFDAAAVTRQANASASAALQALPQQPTLPEVIAALNRAVISFDTGADVIADDAMAILREAAAGITRLPSTSRLLILGHTDNIGNTAANQLLSLRRAEAVRAALVANGAPIDMLAAEGRGDAHPLAGNDTEAGRFRNRRLEFAIAP